VRRLFTYIEHSIGEWAYWAVFEPKRARMKDVDTALGHGRMKAGAENEDSVPRGCRRGRSNQPAVRIPVWSRSPDSSLSALGATYLLLGGVRRSRGRKGVGESPA
jgi:hypothetical protein